MESNKLGDPGVPGGGSDVLYSGDTSGSVFSMNYYRDKALQFQTILNAVDQAAYGAALVIDAGADEQLSDELSVMLSDYDNHKTQLRLTAEAINAGAAAINAMGGRFPSLSIPSGLGLGPLAIPAAAIAAIGVAATLIVWGNAWIRGVNERMKQSNILDAIQDPIAKAQVAAGMAEADNAATVANSSTLSGIASVMKYAAMAAAAFMAWRMYQEYSKGK